MLSIRLRSLATLASFLFAVCLAAESPDPAGHWEGAITLPGQELGLDIDLASDGETWKGDITIPVQGARDLALTKIEVHGSEAAFTISGVGGDPTFKGTVSADGTKLSGTFTQGGASFPFALTRAEKPAAKAMGALDGFEELAAGALRGFEVPGLGFGIVKDGEVILARGFGERDVEAKLPVTADTLFAIGSSTKAFTTFVLGSLVDEGKLGWDDRVADRLPGFKLYDPSATQLATPRDLVTHRIGLPRHDLAWYNNPNLPRSAVIERLAYFEPNEPFRQTFQYNNLMFLTAGYLIEHLTGKSWEENVKTRIFDPLGMASSNFRVAEMQRTADFAQPYEERDKKVVKVPFRALDNMGPAGSINSSVNDMLRWVKLHLADGRAGDEALLSPSTLHELHTPQMVMRGAAERPDISPPSYALGWFVQTYRGHRMVHHGGNIDGFSALVALFPDDGLGFVALTNKGGTGLPMILVRHAADRILGLPPVAWSTDALAKRAAATAASDEAQKKKTSVRRAGTKPAHALAEYAGEYENPGYGPLTVKVVGQGLELDFTGIVTPLEHWHYETWNAAKGAKDPVFEDLKFLFETDVRGNVAAVETQFEPAVGEVRFTKKPDARLSDPAFLARFVGKYDLSGQEISVEVVGGGLVVVQPGAPLLHLVPALGDEFTLKEFPIITARFELDAKGNVTAVLINQPEGVFTAKRKP